VSYRYERKGVSDSAGFAGGELLGFVAYGLSIFLYIRAQRSLGAAKTSAYYAIAPFIGAFLSFVLVGEALTWIYFAALTIMALGTGLVVMDTIVRHHEHMHEHRVTYTHHGVTRTYVIVHSHEHDHYLNADGHTHHHSEEKLRETLLKQGKLI